MKRALAFLAVVAVAGLLAIASRPGPWEQLSGGADGQYYNRLAAGFQKGELSLDRVAPPGLTALPDPYDPVANRSFREASPPLHDLSYRDGKLFLYFGVTPALVVFLPFRILSGHSLSQDSAIWLFCVVGVLAGALILSDLRRRFFAQAPSLILALAIGGFGLATALPVMIARSEVYEVAIAGGFCFSMLGLFFLVRALEPGRSQAGWLAAASVSFGLAVGCRPTLLFGALLLGAPFVLDRGSRVRRQWAAVILPITAIGMALLWYNQARFGRLTEFGLGFQLSSYRGASAHFFSWQYLVTNLRAYFFQPPPLVGQFPFLGRLKIADLPLGHMRVEEACNLLLGAPFLWLAIALPFLLRGAEPAVRRVALLIALFAGINVLVLSLYFFTASRYEVEFAPALGLLAGLALLAWGNRLQSRGAAMVSGGVLLVLSGAFQALAAVAHWGESQADYALLLSQLGRNAEAITVLDQVVTAAPGLPEPHFDRGAILARTGQLPEAIQEFNSGLRLAPANAAGWGNLADALTQSGQFAPAAEAYDKAIALNPADAGLFSHRGFARSRLGRNSEAMIDYGRSTELEPNVLPVRLTYGMMLAEGGRMDQAAAQFAEAVRIDPQSEEARADFGTALASLGRYDESIAQFQAALVLNRSDETARGNLVEALARLGRTREARLVHDHLSP